MKKPFDKAKQMKNSSALLVLEMQNDFLSEGGALYPLLKNVLDEVNTTTNVLLAIKGARASLRKVIHIPIQFSHQHEEIGPEPYGILSAIKKHGALKSKSWGSEFATGFAPQEGDIVVTGKSSIDAFLGTNLDSILRANGINEVVICGLLSNVCIESTIRSAYDRRYRVKALTDATATISMEEHKQATSNSWSYFSEPLTTAEWLSSN